MWREMIQKGFHPPLTHVAILCRGSLQRELLGWQNSTGIIMLWVFLVHFIRVCTVCSVFKLWQVQRVWPHRGHGMLHFSSICWTNKGSAGKGSKEEGKRASRLHRPFSHWKHWSGPWHSWHVESLTASLSSTSLCNLDVSDIWGWRIKWIKSSGCLLHRGRGPKWRSYKKPWQVRNSTCRMLRSS